jgi:hypothetical protein
MSPAEAARLLGVPLDASLEDIQHAYLHAARQVHPDVLPDAGEPELADAAARFDELSQAREVLFEHRPVIPIEVAPAVVAVERGRGIGGSLAVLALLVFLLIAIVSLNDAFRAATVGGLDGRTPPAPSSSP